MNKAFWHKKRVFITGHTGFKGGWLSLWLHSLGAEVHGYALEPPTEPNLFTVCKLETLLKSHTLADVRNAEQLQKTLQYIQPEIILHLAAQPLVRYSYQVPTETYAVNVMGTVNLLEAVRTISSVKAIVNITTDKCYINQEWLWPYRENDALGGNDPYSSSKACTELITHAYRHSFLAKREVHIASARAGNVIGGGDWAMDRLIPDFLRAVDNNSPIIIRSPQAIRPWQHVLEPLSGYLMLAERLFIDGASFSEAWNFGPEQTDMQTVQWIIERLCSYFPKAQWYCQPNFTLSEAQILQLDSSKAKSKLGWFPHWTLSEALSYTLEWYHAWKHGMNMQQISLEQIKAYEMSS